jgi:DNA-binding transcriptional regulator YdaS (Cro superfamily)
MDLNAYFLTGGESVAAFARRLGVPPALVSQWRTGVRRVPLERCVSIEQATEKAVTRKDLRPDDWHLIWPELAAVDRV